jgi:hypothetical protein
MRPGENSPSTLENADGFLRRGMGAARRGRESLLELRTRERAILREWAQAEGRLLGEDPTLRLGPRSSHGEHSVAFDSTSKRWWKITHPGKAGIGAEFDYEMLPPFSVIGIFARELLPSEYIIRMLLHNREFADDVRLEGYLDNTEPSLVISQPHIKGLPATAAQMCLQMKALGYLSLGNLEVGRKNSISFYCPERRIAMFDAHPGNFFHAHGLTIPIDGIIAEIPSDAEHTWLLQHAQT